MFRGGAQSKQLSGLGVAFAFENPEEEWKYLTQMGSLYYNKRLVIWGLNHKDIWLMKEFDWPEGGDSESTGNPGVGTTGYPARATIELDLETQYQLLMMV